MTRRQEREQAFYLIFEKLFHPDLTINELLSNAQSYQMKVYGNYTELLLHKVYDELETIDNVIEAKTVGWKKERISKISLSLLRMAVCEMLYFEDIPISVSINEAVELAKIYSGKEDASFINGLLGNLAREKEEQA